MNLPALLLGTLIASLCGAGFHLWRGGSAGFLLLYLVSAWLGFWIGHAVGNAAGWHFASLGVIRLGMALIGTVVFLAGGYWLSMVEAADHYE